MGANSVALGLSILLVVGNLTAPPADEQASPGNSSYIVEVRPGALDEVVAENGLGPDSTRIEFETVLTGFVTDLTADEAVEIQADPNVLSVSENLPLLLTETQSDAPWNLSRLDQAMGPADAQYTYPGSAGTGVRVYVVDTGVSPNTGAELSGRLGSGFTPYSDGAGTTDCNGHGTHVAGIVASRTWGVAKQAEVIPVRVFPCDNSPALSDKLIQGLDWILSNHPVGTPGVVNLSLTVDGRSNAVDAAVTQLTEAGLFVAVAAGNASSDACGFSPGAVPSVFTVGATNRSDFRAWYSNFGSCLDGFAPGDGIQSLSLSGGAAQKSGTSMATPHVAGIAALILSDMQAPNASTAMAALGDRTAQCVVLDPGPGSRNAITRVPGAPSPLPATPAGNARALVYSLYQDVHGRSPDPVGLCGWIDGMSRLGKPASSVVDGVLASTEYYSARIAESYQYVLSRQPEPSGAAYWLREIETSRLKVDDLAMIHTASDEFFQVTAGGDPRQFVEILYQRLLGRSASESERTYWASQISSRGRYAIVVAVYQSNESAARRINSLYMDYFQRSADPSGIITYTPLVLNSGDHALRGILVNSPEYLDRARIRYPTI